MKFYQQIDLFFLIGWMILSSGGIACTASRSQNAPLQKGQAPFQFETKKISSFEIAHFDPATGASWTAQFKRNPESFWEIASGPGGTHLIDRKAHSNLIDHFLDTLKTLQITGPAPHGPPEAFDLSPPRFAIRWNDQEFRLGSGKFASIGSSIYEVEGAALKLIEYFEKFESLRDQTWLSPLSSDEIDEVELLRGGRKIFYAQREGSLWTNARHQPLKADVSFFLDQITHARIREFIDKEEVSHRLIDSIRKKPLHHITFKDRLGNTTEAYLKWETLAGTRKLFSLTSSRPTAVFQVFDEATRFFEPLKP